jgi:hypothetical protein
MSKLVTSAIQHPSASVPNLVLNADGTVDGPGSNRIVAVKFAIEDTAATQSTASQGIMAGVSIAHTADDAANLIYCIGQVSGTQDQHRLSVVFRVDSVIQNAPASPGSRTQTMGDSFIRVSNEGMGSVTGVGQVVAGDTSSHTYSFDLINVDGSTRTLYRNRSVTDTNNSTHPRGVCTMTLFEVKP